MLIELKEESWEYNRIPEIEKRFNRKYIKNFNDRFYIDLDDLYNLMSFLEDELTSKEEKELEDKEATMQEEIWEGKRQ